MIAFATPRTKSSSAEQWQAKFLELLPAIDNQARVAFRGEPAERRQDLIAEVIANCWVAFVRLMERGLEDMVYPTPLAQYAIRQVRSGRKVGSQLNVRDVSSEYAQRSKGFVVRNLDRYDKRKHQWKEVLVEDRQAGPAETAASRIDFGDWLQSLPCRSRRIAETLATGETTKKVAKRFCVSAGRISQLRRELKDAWEAFQEEAQAPVAVAGVL
jgi:hypothetical protein